MSLLLGLWRNIKWNFGFSLFFNGYFFEDLNMFRPISILLLVTATLLSSAANAAKVNFTTVSLGGNHYRYDYVIHNDGSLGSGQSIQLIDLLFDPALYDESTLTNSSDSALASSWSQQFLGSAPGIPAAFDLLSTGLGIAVGSEVNGFSVEFLWLGLGAPGHQIFEIYDPNSFALLEQGTTTTSIQTPLPGAFPMMATGISLLSVFRRKPPNNGEPRLSRSTG
jgi:hypothetical protein